MPCFRRMSPTYPSHLSVSLSVCPYPRVRCVSPTPQAVSEGEEVTLMDWGNCIFKKVAKGADGAVTGIEARAAQIHHPPPRPLSQFQRARA